ncbi:MAG: EAL domain-containing protein [Deltaproteobacteria bacterium]|nr:EAL domain-containing protein [Deltaproteobacteria bacterium]
MPRTNIDNLLKIQKSISAMEGLVSSGIRDSVENCKAILNAINETACVIDSSGGLIHINEALEKASGRSAAWCAGRPFTLLFEESEAQTAISFHSRAMSRESFAAGLTLKGSAALRQYGLFPLLDARGQALAVCVIAREVGAKDELETAVSKRTCELMDINQKLLEELSERKSSESEQLVFLTHYDPVTGLFNRTHFIDLLNARLARPGNGTGALLLLDIDQFKFISDSYGHGMGDEFLRRVAKLLQFNTRYLLSRVLKEEKDSLLISRLSGDEFAVFLPASGMVEAVEAAEYIRSAIECFYQPEMHCHMTASIGIALFPEHGRSVSELLTRADAAMYRAKDQGRNRFHLYSPEEREIEQMHMRLKWKENILAALKDDRFAPWYQPIMGLADNSVTHYEVLARMTDYDGSIVLPGPFIDIAERFGLVGAISRAIFTKAFNLQAALQKEGRPMRLCLNVSGKELGDREFLYFLRSSIFEKGLDPANLVFEITETASIHDLDKAMSFIAALKATGCHVALDDFGIGFTSFLYLREMQVDYIKIAGSFIKALDQNLNDQLFVKAITEVARGMGIKTIGEFVETDGILEHLRKFGVDYAQGYLIGRPAPAIIHPGVSFPADR